MEKHKFSIHYYYGNVARCGASVPLWCFFKVVAHRILKNKAFLKVKFFEQLHLRSIFAHKMVILAYFRCDGFTVFTRYPPGIGEMVYIQKVLEG